MPGRRKTESDMSDNRAYDAEDEPGEEDKNEALASDRTKMAEDRTIMAVERTFAGWMRTAFGAIGIGVAFHVLFGDFHPPWLAKAIASVFIGFAIFLALNAEKRATSSLERMQSHALEKPELPRFRLLSRGVAICAALLLAGLWILNDGTFGDG
jgi:putative membrane protein